jgi:hypothetical protein
MEHLFGGPVALLNAVAMNEEQRMVKRRNAAFGGWWYMHIDAYELSRSDKSSLRV